MKSVFNWTVIFIGFLIGIFGFFVCAFISSGVHASRYWSFIGWLGLLLPILTPYSFDIALSFEKVSLEHIKKILIIGIVLDTLLLISSKIELKHMVGSSDVIWSLSFWGVWQLTLVLAYFLKVRSDRKN